MKNILVVEDNESNLYLLTFLLQQFGYKTVEATTGHHAVTLASEEKFDLIIMDIQLPDINGLDATRLIRASNNMVPVIALTSYAMPGDREHAIDAGCSGYIQKPIDPDTFIDEIGRYLNVTSEALT
jgi:two-component system, cell cycle response regulator DivK